MKTNRNVSILLENGFHFSTISKMKPNEVKLLAEKFFKSRPMGDVGQAKKDSLKSMKAFIKKYLGIENPDGLSYKEALEKMKLDNKDLMKELAKYLSLITITCLKNK